MYNASVGTGSNERIIIINICIDEKQILYLHVSYELII